MLMVGPERTEHYEFERNCSLARAHLGSASRRPAKKASEIMSYYHDRDSLIGADW